MASSADGIRLVALEYNGLIYTSADAGVTWTSHDSARFWTAVASSADGSTVVAGGINEQLHTSLVDRTTVGAGGFLAGAQYDAVALQYLGGGLFMPLSYQSYSGAFVVQ